MNERLKKQTGEKMIEEFSFFGTINPLVIIYFVFFILSIIMGVWVYAKNRGSYLAKVFLALTTSIAFVHLGEIFFSWSIFKPDAFFSHALSSVGFVSWWPLTIHLLLLIKQKKIGLKWGWFLGGCYLYAFVSCITIFTGYNASLDYIRSGLTWIDKPNWTILGSVYLILLPIWIIQIISVIVSIYRKANRNKNVVLLRQFQYIAGVGVPMVVIGIFFNLVLPALGTSIPAIGHIFLGVWVLTLGFVITKYRFLVPTMEFASREIITIAGEIILITDLQYYITEVNDAFEVKLGYSKNTEMYLPSIIDNFPKSEISTDSVSIANDIEVKLTKKNNEMMHGKLKRSLLYDNGIAIGIVFVISDITELKNKNQELEEKVFERTNELKVAKDEAERMLRITQVYTRRSIVNIIQNGGDPTTFPPANKKVNILFSDIRDFTSLSENLTPLATVELLNIYFEKMNECVSNCNGEIDKLIGDCIMAIFEKSEDAVLCAITMRQKLLEINETNRLRMRLNNGIGINYGEVTAGNIGSQSKMDWTVIGDIVNSASRLESLTKVYGLPIIISEDMVNNLSQKHQIRFIDHVLVKGKKSPFKIFELFDYENDSIKSIKKYNQELMDKAFGLYTSGDFKNALDIYIELRSDYGPHRYMINRTADPVIDFYIERCIRLNELMNKDLLDRWNGVYEFLDK